MVAPPHWMGCPKSQNQATLSSSCAVAGQWQSTGSCRAGCRGVDHQDKASPCKHRLRGTARVGGMRVLLVFNYIVWLDGCGVAAEVATRLHEAQVVSASQNFILSRVVVLKS